MGFLDSLLEVPERLRVWQLAGIQYFYLDPDAPAAVPEAAAAHDAPQMPAQAEVLQLPAVAVDPATWPEPWPGIFRKTPPGPRLVITYAALGLDMTGRADPRRSALWHKLIRTLGLAGANAVAFWPHVLPDTADAAYDAAIFLAGLELLRPEALAVFGELPDAAAASLRQRFPALGVFVLADPQTLLGGDTEAWNAAISALGGR